MKAAYARRYRRRSPSTREAPIAKKDQQEQPFFGTAGKNSFFKPMALLSRKCDHCEAEVKSVKRQVAGKEEEKKVSRKEEEKKDEKLISRQAANKEEEKKISKKEEEKKEKPLARKEQAEAKSSSPESSTPQTSQYISSLNGKGQTLSGEVRDFFEARMGYDFSHVKVHTDASAQASAKEVQAKAYTVDNNIVFNKGQFNPSSDDGKKLIAHELAHVMQNDPGNTVRRKPAPSEEEKDVTISIDGTGGQSRTKSAKGGCNIPSVDGLTEFATKPSTYKVKGAKTKTSTTCEACEAPECIVSKGTIESKFSSTTKVTLPDVPEGLTKCETAAVKKFIKGTLKKHEQEHVKAFKTYNGTVKTPYTFTGCKSDLAQFIQDKHNDLDSQRSSDAIAKSDALDPFVKPIPCDCND